MLLPSPRMIGTAAVAVLLTFSPSRDAQAYTHPGMPLTNADLTQLNANKNTAPWSTGYALFTGAGETHTKLNYVMRGPKTDVGRTPDVNRNEFSNDIRAIQGLALQWKFTGDPAYAELAKSILLAWATTHTTWSGAESYLDSGDYIDPLVLGASILRSYSGWTAANTTTVKNYLNNVWWGQSAVPNPLRSANQGALQLKVAMGVAVYCDDTTKFNQCVTAFRTDACAALANTFSNGQFGDMGRDQGHAYGQLQSLTWVAEIAWKSAGVDLFSLDNNRLRTCAEYYCGYNNGGSPAFIKSGTCYGLYDSIGGVRVSSRGTQGSHLLHGAYILRKGLSMPELTTFRNNSGDSWDTWVYRKSADSSTATIPSGTYTYPTTSAVTALTGAQVGAGLAGSVSNSGGTWTVAGSGRDIYGPSSDGFYYAYQQRSGDFAMVARVTAQSGTTNPGAMGGVMIRENLTTTSNMLAVGVKTGTNGAYATQRGAAASSHNTAQQGHPLATMPYWVKVERRGTTLTSYDSPDGVNWTAVINTVSASAPTVYVGLCVSAHDEAQLNTVTFTNVGITGGTLVNRATGGTATASWQNAPNEAAAKAFDASTASKWYNYSGGTYAPTGWLQYQLSSPRTVLQYRITSANDVPLRDPKNWQLQGSNDGTNWTLLNSQINQTFGARFQTNTYGLTSPASYLYYRLNITANNGGAGYGIQLSEFALMAD